MKPTSVQVLESQWDNLEDYGKKIGVSVASLIRIAISEFLKDINEGDLDNTKK